MINLLSLTKRYFNFLKKSFSDSFTIIFIVFNLIVVILAISIFLIYKTNSINKQYLATIKETKTTITQCRNDLDFIKNNINRNYIDEIVAAYNKNNWPLVIALRKEYITYSAVSGKELSPSVLPYTSYAMYLTAKNSQDTNSSKLLYEQAVRDIDEFLKIKETSSALFIKALLLLQEENTQSYLDAKKNLKKALKRSSDINEKNNINYHTALSDFYIALVYNKNKEYSKCLDQLRKAESLLPKFEHKNKNNLMRDINLVRSWLLPQKDVKKE